MWLWHMFFMCLALFFVFSKDYDWGVLTYLSNSQTLLCCSEHYLLPSSPSLLFCPPGEHKAINANESSRSLCSNKKLMKDGKRLNGTLRRDNYFWLGSSGPVAALCLSINQHFSSSPYQPLQLAVFLTHQYVMVWECGRTSQTLTHCTLSMGHGSICSLTWEYWVRLKMTRKQCQRNKGGGLSSCSVVLPV